MICAQEMFLRLSSAIRALAKDDLKSALAHCVSVECHVATHWEVPELEACKHDELQASTEYVPDSVPFSDIPF